jgi:2-octaprenyl-6-methoxyphenol hydroxylase
VPARTIGLSLVQRLEDTNAAKLYCPATVTGIETDSDGVTVSVEQGGVVSEIRAGLAVLADGGVSRTREMLGIEARTRNYGQSAVLCTVTPENPRPGTAFERFTDTGPLAVLPTTGRRCAVVWTAASEEVEGILEWSDDEFLARLQDRFGDWLGALGAPSRRRAYPLRLIEVPDPVHQRALVIGNAAHTIHPVAGQGFNLGLRDAAVLAEVLHTQATQGRDIGHAGVLRMYRDWRRRDVRNTPRFTDSLIRVFTSDLPPLAAGRNIGLTALNICPPAKRFLVKRTMGLNGRLPRLARGVPLT